MEDDERNARVWYENATEIIKDLLIGMHTNIDRLEENSFADVVFQCDETIAKKEHYEGLLTIAKSLKECVELLEFPELVEKNI
tara:strand:+ start:436 stop:684 length:249 start_codon:yes stop_codon:yes gene_type:complete